MSIEYYTYVKEVISPTTEEISNLLSSIGWKLKFYNNDNSAYTGDKLTNCLVMGWPTNIEFDLQLNKMSNFSDEIVNELFEKDIMGTAALYIDTEYKLSEELEEDEIEELREDIGSDLVDYFESSKFQATTRTSSGRNERSVELQYLLAYAIATVNGGLLEDEMEGDYLKISKDKTIPSLKELGF